ncbi:ATP12 family chaperone protein [Celeribacter arenosi]|uniref:ATPase n=1 Tax=Celeribacter arenosi TaxID=792649 RepID=A0ABP7K530_9RHOB
MSEWKAKRFWKSTEVVETEGGYSILLDTRPVRTPAKAPLVVPARELAEAIAAEWDAQSEAIDPRTMPATRGANAAIDKVRIQHAEVADMLAEYGDCDLLCYRAAHPQELVTRQSANWDPILEWAGLALRARLAPREGVVHAPQDAVALAQLRERVHSFDEFELAAFHDLVTISGSLILAFAVTEGFLSETEAWQLSRLDEDYQSQQWGVDEEAEELAQTKRESFCHAAQFFRSVKNQA